MPYKDRVKWVSKYYEDRVVDLFDISDQKDIEKIKRKQDDLFDYSDSIIRYFRQTGFIYFRGSGRYIDLSVEKETEISRLLEWSDGSAKHFEDEIDYINYLQNIEKPDLPWENISDEQNLKSISKRRY